MYLKDNFFVHVYLVFKAQLFFSVFGIFSKITLKLQALTLKQRQQHDHHVFL